jgi:hypothetical protein
MSMLELMLWTAIVLWAPSLAIIAIAAVCDWLFGGPHGY